MLTEFLKNELLNHVFRGVNYTAPTSLYVGLVTAEGEVSVTEYERIEIPCAESSFDLDQNSSTITSTQSYAFPLPTVDWTNPGYPVNRWGIYDEAEGGNLLDSGDLATSIDILADSPSVVLLAGQVTFQLGS